MIGLWACKLQMMQVKGAVVNVSQGCAQTPAGTSSSCSEASAFDADLSTLRGQTCGFKVVLLPHGDTRDSSAWPEPFQGKPSTALISVALLRLGWTCLSALLEQQDRLAVTSATSALARCLEPRNPPQHGQHTVTAQHGLICITCFN